MTHSDQFREWWDRAYAFQEKGNARAALACFDILLDLLPNNANAWFAKACTVRQFAQEESDLNEEAMLLWEAQCCEEALRYDNTLTIARFNLAGIYKKLNRFLEAARLLQQIIDA